MGSSFSSFFLVIATLSGHLQPLSLQLGSAFVIEPHDCSGLVENELPLRIAQKLHIIEYNASVKLRPANQETNNNYGEEAKSVGQQQWCLVRLANLENEPASNQIVEGYVPLRCIKVTCCGSSGRTLNTPSKSLDEGNKLSLIINTCEL